MSRLRLVFAALGAFIVVAAPAGAKLAPEEPGRARLTVNAGSSARLLEINVFRARRGLRPLVASPSLATAATSHSLDMARSGYFAHESSNGNPFAVRVKRFYPTAGYRMWRAGETLLWASPTSTPRAPWPCGSKSPEHRRVLLTPAWRELGVSAVHTPSGPRVSSRSLGGHGRDRGFRRPNSIASR